MNTHDITQSIFSKSTVSKTAVTTGWIIIALCSMFLLFDSIIHILNIPAVVQAFNRLGVPNSLALGIGILEILCIAIYVSPRTSMLGAILLTGYLGGATALNLRIGDPYGFPIILGVFVWAGLYLRDGKLRTLIPVRM